MAKKIFKGSPSYFALNDHSNNMIYLMLTLPFKCNYRCTKCFNLINNSPTNSNNTLKVDEFKQQVAKFKDFGGRAVVIAGEGEPTLFKEINNFVSYIFDKGLIPIIYTNGSMLTKEILDFYYANNVSIVIALDSLNPLSYNNHTNTKNKLPVVLKNIENARKIYSSNIKKSEENKIVQIAINTTISSINKHEIEQIKKFCGDDIYFICNPVANYGNAANNWNSLIKDTFEYEELGEMAKRLSDSGGPLTLNEDGLCGYSRNGISINAKGDFMTCAYTCKTSGLLGNIKEMSVVEAFDMKYELEGAFYEKFGNAPCLIRDSNFIKFLETLKNIQGTRGMV